MIQYPFGVGDIQTRVLESGAGSRNVVFLHGVGARADRWAPTMERYAAAGYHCFAFDFPGHGFATKGKGPDYSVPGFASLTHRLLQGLGVGKAALIGTSLGGSVAGHVAVAAPDSVRGLVLVGSVGLVPLSEEIVNLISQSLPLTDYEQIEHKLRVVFSNEDLVTPELITEEWRINSSPGADVALSKLGEYWKRAINSDMVGASLVNRSDDLPLRLVWGTDDHGITVDVGRAAAQLLTEGELYLVPNAGHAPYLENPQIFDEATLPFLETLSWS